MIICFARYVNNVFCISFIFFSFCIIAYNAFTFTKNFSEFFSFKKKILFFTDHKPAYSIITLGINRLVNPWIFFSLLLLSIAPYLASVYKSIFVTMWFSPVVCSSSYRSLPAKSYLSKYNPLGIFYSQQLIPSPVFSLPFYYFSLISFVVLP